MIDQIKEIRRSSANVPPAPPVPQAPPMPRPPSMMNNPGANLPLSQSGGIPMYYVCSPSAPPFIPASPSLVAPPIPSHYPYLYSHSYPQLSPMMQPASPNSLYMTGYLQPPPMTYPCINSISIIAMNILFLQLFLKNIS